VERVAFGAMMKTYPMYIAGGFREKEENIAVEDPFTEEVFAQIPQADQKDLTECIEKARAAQKIWQRTPLKERADLISDVSHLILDHLKELAEIESKEIGKPIKETLLVDVPLAAHCFEYYGSLLKNFPTSPTASRDETVDIVHYLPFGVAGIFLPYNVPLMIFGFNAAAALAAGNAVIVKLSEFGSLSLLTLAKYLHELEFPSGLINFITGEGPVIGRALAASDVDIISFTGSSNTLQEIFKQITRPKKLLCELSGVNIAAIFADADKEEALENLIASTFMKQGQMCIGSSIALVEENIYDEFLSMLVHKTEKIKMGNPLSSTTHMGPVRSKGHLEKVIHKVERLKKMGRVIIGGNRIEMQGYFFEPTVIEILEMIYEECFEPILLVKKCGQEEMEKLIEDNPTGLVMQIWTQDMKKAYALAMKAHYGTIWINTFAQMDTTTPFGGCKASGWGRVLGRWGLFEYLQPKHIGLCFAKSQASGWFG
jgi:acyl-CoA reductase-like NAD-dependent aldehyde dehydrogenase